MYCILRQLLSTLHCTRFKTLLYLVWQYDLAWFDDDLLPLYLKSFHEFLELATNLKET